MKQYCSWLPSRFPTKRGKDLTKSEYSKGSGELYGNRIVMVNVQVQGTYSPNMKQPGMIGQGDVILKRFSSTPYPYATPRLHIY